jgi:hypothetical protein
MNIRLQTLFHEAETRLAEAEQDRLAEIVEVFLATSGPDADFTPEELAELRALDAEPYDPAPAAEVAALFARRAGP